MPDAFAFTPVAPVHVDVRDGGSGQEPLGTSGRQSDTDTPPA